MPEFTPPVETHPPAVVENVFDLPDHPPTPNPDYESQDRFEDFLWERLEPEAQPTPGGRILVPGTRRVVERRGHDGWFYWGAGTARRFWLGLAAVNLMFNAGVNVHNIESAAKDGVELVQGLKDRVEDHFGIGEICTDVKPGVTTESRTHSSFQIFLELEKVGSPEPSQAGVANLVSNLVRLQNTPDTKVTRVLATALASDEWRSKKPDIGLGTPDKENADQLAPNRLNTFMQAITESGKLQGLDLSKVEVNYQEVVLPAEVISSIDQAVKSHGFKNIDQALDVFNTRPEQLDPETREVMYAYFGENRGMKVEVDYETAAVTKLPPKKVGKDCAPDGSPEKHHDYDWDGFLLPLVPWPIFRRRMVEKIKSTYVDIPPTMPDPEFLLLYPEAQIAADELSRESWAYARKYQNLFRETDRITGTYRLEYQDADGELQTLRAMFVDHVPTPESINMIAGTLQKISQMQGGRVGKELDMAVIYPSENAGLHGDPKQVGLGLDIQREFAVHGIAYPSLSLVELHMPPKPTKQELEGFNGAQWVLAHEIAGHFTDLNNERNRLNLLTTVDGIPIYAAANRFADSAQDDFDRITNQEAGGDTRSWWQRLLRRPYNTNLPWHIRRGTRMVSGEIEDRDEIVATTDPRLVESTFVRIGRFISRYSRDHAAEHYAESAANIATGIGVPFEEEPEAEANGVRGRPGYADTYNASDSMHQHITERWDSDPGADFTVFPDEPEARRNWRHWYGRLQDDPTLYPLVEESRNQPLPEDRDLLHILTGRRIKAKK